MDLLFQNRLNEAHDKCLAIINGSAEPERSKHEASFCHILNSLGRFSESKEILQKLCVANPNDHRLLHNLGAVLRMMGRYDEAIGIFRRETSMLSTHDPGYVLSVAANEYELAKTNHMMGNCDAALEHATRSFIFSEKCDDPIMHGCAYRMLADLYVKFSKTLGLSAYQVAKEKFKSGDDPRAVADIDERIEAVNSGKDPKYIS